MPGTTAQPQSAETLEVVASTLRERRTIAMFEERPVDRETIMQAIEVARWAPNHRLTEPWRFYLVGEKAREATLHWVEVVTTEKANAEVGARKAGKWAKVPGWLLVTCKRSDDALLEQEDYAACACAIHNLSLYLWRAGIGMKWSSGAITRDARYLKALGIDEDNEFVVGLISYGYPKIVPTQKRRPVDDIAVNLP